MSQFSITTFRALIAQVTGKKDERFAAFAEGMGQAMYAAASNTLLDGSGALKQAVNAIAVAKGGKAAMLRKVLQLASSELSQWQIIQGDCVTPANGYIGGNSPKVTQAEKEKRELGAIAFGNAFRDGLLQVEAARLAEKAAKKAAPEEVVPEKKARKGHDLAKTAKRMIALRKANRALVKACDDLERQLAVLKSDLESVKPVTKRAVKKAA